MENFDFCDLLILARSIYVDFDKLLCEGSDGCLVSASGVSFGPDSPSRLSRAFASDEAYDKIATLIKVLKGIQEFRPLSF